MPSRPPAPLRDRRRQKRRAGNGFPLLSPAAATIVDCGPRGLGIETSSHLTVGSVTSVNVFVPTGQMELLGRVCWARLVANRSRADGDSEPVFRAGLSYVEGRTPDAWNRLLECLAAGERHAARPRRRVVRWRRPSAI